MTSETLMAQSDAKEAGTSKSVADKPIAKTGEAEVSEAESAQAKPGKQTTSKDAEKPAVDDKPAGNPKPKAEAETEQPATATSMEDPSLEQEWIAKGVWLSPPQDGPAARDFSLVGEYLGEIGAGEEESQLWGIQVRALGDGAFEARGYVGGLPGQDGASEDEMMVLIGRRSGDTLVLSGGPWAMFAGPDQCRVINAEGEQLGTLPRANRASRTLGAKAPEGAMVLFDGSGTDQFVNGRLTPGGLLRQGADIQFMLNDFDLHVEFRIPHMPKFLEQQRGNSGLYLQSRYECQILDSFGAARVFNGLGALYRHRKADVNMALPPLVWQTYDVHFTAARFGANGKKLRNAQVTSWVNGVMVQDSQELPGPTGHGQPESPTLLPTKLQDHKDPIRYRNVWVVDRGLASGVPFPQMAGEDDSDQ
ncbi:3-keto-disaccharide hydrolase [Neorhodopirellula lusitana]|nr:DUF1080 domain-containing protein [Neorhodopirellula lusitana]